MINIGSELKFDIVEIKLTKSYIDTILIKSKVISEFALVKYVYVIF